MDRKINGFTLIELLVVIVIMGVIFSIGINLGLNWKKKLEIESDTKKIYSLLKESQQKAFNEKIELEVYVSNGKICYKCDTSDLDCKNIYGTSDIKCYVILKDFSGNSINISKRGTFTNGTIRYTQVNDSVYDCVVVSLLRAKIGKWNNGNQKCE